MFDILFENATILTMDDLKPVLENGFLGITGKKITYLGEDKPDETANRVINCAGDVLMPGLVNAHAHTAMVILRGYADDLKLKEWLYDRVFPAEGRLDKRAACAGFKLGVAEMLSTGTTSFSDMYFFEADAARIASDTGIRARLCNAVLAPGDDFDFYSDRSILETLEMLSDNTLPHDRVRPQMGIHAEYTSSPDIWRQAVEFAKAHSLDMHVHLSETKREHDECIARHGITPARCFAENGVFDVPTIAAHCCHITDEDMGILAKYGVTAVHNPVSNLKLASGIADVPQMIKHGINVAIGTDGCCSNNTLDMFEDIKFAALLAKNLHGDPALMSAYDALKLATVNGARAQGFEGVTGQLKEGFDADLILISMDALSKRPVNDPVSGIVYCASGRDVYMTMVQGKLLYERGEFYTIDIEETLFEVEHYAAPLLCGTRRHSKDA